MLGRVNHQSKRWFKTSLVKFKNFRSYWGIGLLAALGVFTLLLLWMAYLRWGMGYDWAVWTGFGDYTGSVARDNRGRTLWEWLELLIVPFALALIAVWFSRAERFRQEKLSKDRQNEAALQSYMDKMTELLLSQGLRKTKDPDDEERIIARVRTLTVLRELDPLRKGILLRFLIEAELITRDNPIIDLTGADFGNADLKWVVLGESRLCGVNFRGAKFGNADLSEADLSGADFTRADLEGANLNNAILIKSDLSEARLARADLSEAVLSGARISKSDLYRANLKGAIIEEGQFRAALLNETTLPDGNVTDWQPRSAYESRTQD